MNGCQGAGQIYGLDHLCGGNHKAVRPLKAGDPAQVAKFRHVPVPFAKSLPQHTVIGGSPVARAVSGAGGQAVVGIGHQGNAALQLWKGFQAWHGLKFRRSLRPWCRFRLVPLPFPVCPLRPFLFPVCPLQAFHVVSACDHHNILGRIPLCDRRRDGPAHICLPDQDLRPVPVFPLGQASQLRPKHTGACSVAARLKGMLHHMFPKGLMVILARYLVQKPVNPL